MLPPLAVEPIWLMDKECDGAEDYRNGEFRPGAIPAEPRSRPGLNGRRDTLLSGGRPTNRPQNEAL